MELILAPMFKFEAYKINSGQNCFNRIGLPLQKIIFLLIAVISFQFSSAQIKTKNFGNIDWKVREIDAGSLDSLAFRLTSPYQLEIH